MTDFIDSDLDEEDAEFLKERAKYETARNTLIARLESHFSHRGLKFTVPFTGSIPNVALGDIDGMRFAFRYRGDYAYLEVGIMDITKAEADYNEEFEYWEDNVKDSGGFLSDIEPIKPITTGTHVRPNIILLESSKDNVTGDPYSSYLSPKEAESLFIELVDNLTEIS